MVDKELCILGQNFGHYNEATARFRLSSDACVAMGFQVDSCMFFTTTTANKLYTVLTREWKAALQGEH